MSAKLIKPALYKIEGLPWAWVKIEDLAFVLEIEVSQVVNFFNLTKDLDKAILTISNGEKMFEITEGDPLWRVGGFYVPAGWADAVLKAAEMGVVSVIVVSHVHLGNGEPCPEGTLNCTFDGGGFLAAVGLLPDGTPCWKYADCTHPLNRRVQVGEYGEVYEICSRCGAVIPPEAPVELPFEDWPEITWETEEE
jgi:hypothetical protein